MAPLWISDVVLLVLIALSALITYLSLRTALPVGRWLGPTGINVLTRLAGILVAAKRVRVLVVPAVAPARLNVTTDAVAILVVLRIVRARVNVATQRVAISVIVRVKRTHVIAFAVTRTTADDAPAIHHTAS